MSSARFPSSAAASAIAFGIIALSASRVEAQHTPDPYNIVGDYNRQYEPYLYATDPNDSGAMANQARLGGRNRNSSGPAQGDDTVSMDGVAPDLRARRGRDGYAPRPDRARDRSYRPNEKSDGNFYAEQNDRDERYLDALSEPDPTVRAKKMREFQADDRSGKTKAAPKTKSARQIEAERLKSTGSRLIDDADLPEDDTSRTAPPSGTSRRSVAPPPPSSRSRATAPPRDSGLTRPSSRVRAAGVLPGRTSPSRAGTTTGRSPVSPKEVLERSKEIDKDSGVKTGPVDPRTLEPPR